MARIKPLRRGDKGKDYGPTIKTIQAWLKELRHYRGEIDGVFGSETEMAVISFQEESELYADGIVGPLTMAALEDAIQLDAIERSSPGVGTVEGLTNRMRFVKCEADAYGEGYDFLWLRQDAAEDYQKVLKRVHDLGGILTSSGGKRSLYTKVSPNRSAMSFHYLGLALDLQVWSGMVKPKTDPYVVIMNSSDDGFEVFVRCGNNNGTEMTLENIITYEDKESEPVSSVTGRFQSLTQIFKDHGYKPIKLRTSFFEKKRKSAAEWWHFQYERALCPKVSTFGGELLKVYSKEQLIHTPPWKHKNRIFENRLVLERRKPMSVLTLIKEAVDEFVNDITTLDVITLTGKN